MLNQFKAGSKRLNRVGTVVNTSGHTNTDLTGSLESITIPTQKRYSASGKTSTKSTIVNTKPAISNFYTQILQYSGEYVKKRVNVLSNELNILIVTGSYLDYGTEEASAENFEIFVNGLQIPGNFKVEQISQNIVITLHDEYIDFDTVILDDIEVFGKIKTL